MKLDYNKYLSIINVLSQKIGFDEAGISSVNLPDFFQKQFSKEISLPEDMSWLRKHLPIKKNPALLKMTYFEKTFKSQRIITDYPKSFIVLASSYYGNKKELPPNSILHKVSLYAHGKDYHKLLKKKANELVLKLKELYPDFQSGIYVDTSPLSEKLLALSGGLGRMGKNTLIINKKLGSYFFITVIANNIEIENFPSEIKNNELCKNCSLCIDTCPTNALSPYKLEISKCISYLTVEKKNLLNDKELDLCKNHLFGCDICQNVCPYNKHKLLTKSTFFTPLESLLNCTPPEFYRKLETNNNILQSSVLKRAGREKLLQMLKKMLSRK